MKTIRVIEYQDRIVHYVCVFNAKTQKNEIVLITKSKNNMDVNPWTIE